MEKDGWWWHSWSVGLGGKQEEIVERVNYPLRLHVLLGRVQFAHNRPINNVVSHFVVGL